MNIGSVLIGAAKQVINEVTSRVVLPGGMMPSVPVGDVSETHGADQRAGADAVHRWVDKATGRRDRLDPQAARTQRALVASVTVTSQGTGGVRLVVAADAPDASWDRAGGECGALAVYVDGRYHSTLIVAHERREAYVVALGVLASGAHNVELRAATDVAPCVPRVTGAQARAATAVEDLVDRYAPVFVLRDDVRGTGRLSGTHDDAPLLTVPCVTQRPGGGTRIEYRVVMSNENGGSWTDELFANYGRGVDSEALYRVDLDASGAVESETYQSAVHAWSTFDGTREGTRPVLRVSTTNNLVSAWLDTGAMRERWAEAPVAAVVGGTSEAKDFSIMRAHAWTWSMSSKELLRDGAAVGGAQAARGAHQIGDPRSYVYLAGIDDAMRAALALRGGLELVLADGRRVVAAVRSRFARGEFHQTAVELPEGVLASAVRGVALLGARALVLDDAFSVRDLPVAA